MKKTLFTVVVLLMALVLAGCAANPTYPEAGTNYQRDPLSVPTDTPAPSLPDLPEDYDPASEEDNGASYVYNSYSSSYDTSIYAGATPIPLDPIDMPTPTPKPTLTFSYGLVTSDALHLSFEAPVGWGIDTSVSDTVTRPSRSAGSSARSHTEKS